MKSWLMIYELRTSGKVVTFLILPFPISTSFSFCFVKIMCCLVVQQPFCNHEATTVLLQIKTYGLRMVKWKSGMKLGP